MGEDVGDAVAPGEFHLPAARKHGDEHEQGWTIRNGRRRVNARRQVGGI